MRPGHRSSGRRPDVPASGVRAALQCRACSLVEGRGSQAVIGSSDPRRAESPPPAWRAFPDRPASPGSPGHERTFRGCSAAGQGAARISFRIGPRCLPLPCGLHALQWPRTSAGRATPGGPRDVARPAGRGARAVFLRAVKGRARGRAGPGGQRGQACAVRRRWSRGPDPGLSSAGVADPPRSRLRASPGNRTPGTAHREPHPGDCPGVSARKPPIPTCSCWRGAPWRLRALACCPPA